MDQVHYLAVALSCLLMNCKINKLTISSVPGEPGVVAPKWFNSKSTCLLLSQHVYLCGHSDAWEGL